MKRLSAIQSVWGSVALLIFWLAACHDAPRNNPLDSKTAPPFILISVITDPLQGTATLMWSKYPGDLRSFKHYHVAASWAAVDSFGTRVITIPVIAETTYVDTGLEADIVYTYSLSVITTSGAILADRPEFVPIATFPIESPRLQVGFDSRTASAVLSWSRALSGFERYEVHRQTEGQPGTLILHRMTDIDDTRFIDTGLLGGTEYTYTVTARSTVGRVAESAPASGTLHAFLRAWTVPGQMTGGIAIDAEDHVYVSSTDPNRIYRFSGEGELLHQFPTDPVSPNRISTSLAADRHGVYAVVWATATGSYAFVNALDPSGELRFRWPSGVPTTELTGIAVSPDGDIWVSQLNASGGSSSLYLLDVTTGVAADTLEVPMPVRGLSVDRDIGLAIDEIRFGVFDLSTGQVLRTVGGPGSGKGKFSRAVASASGTDSRVFAVDGLNARIQVFSDWAYLTMWGQAGETPGSFRFSGQPSFGPSGVTQVLAGIAVDSQGNIYVADTFNNRIQVFAP